MATKRSAAAISIERGFKHDSHFSYPWKVPAILSPCRVMLDSIQHQIQRKYSHTEYGSSTHCHLFPQLHPPLEQDSFQGLNIKKWPWCVFYSTKKRSLNEINQSAKEWEMSSYTGITVSVALLRWSLPLPYWRPPRGLQQVAAVDKGTKSAIAGKQSVSFGQTTATGGLLQSSPCVQPSKSMRMQ